MIDAEVFGNGSDVVLTRESRKRNEVLPADEAPGPVGPCLNTYVPGSEEYSQLDYTRAFGDGPRNFEPWSSDVDDN
ncbi:hypothetical protein TNCV_3910311 [Trichonephila clavipes]|nr:hypothetical protein TNCV_3910311 [Trichonephila clavipes]